jgi:hypothetical protein
VRSNVDEVVNGDMGDCSAEGKCASMSSRISTHVNQPVPSH